MLRTKSSSGAAGTSLRASARSAAASPARIACSIANTRRVMPSSWARADAGRNAAAGNRTAKAHANSVRNLMELRILDTQNGGRRRRAPARREELCDEWRPFEDENRQVVREP